KKTPKHPETFAPHAISFTPDEYTAMTRVWHLTFNAIESTGAVGPCFYAEIIYRKAAVRKAGYMRGWQLILSHELKTGITFGFCKGTPSSDLVMCLMLAKCCISELGHPMLLPALIPSQDISAQTDIKQRNARDWLGNIEFAASQRSTLAHVDLDAINRDLVECHAQIFWKQPAAYLQIIKSFKATMSGFHARLTRTNKYDKLQKVHFEIGSRLEFYEKRLHGIRSYANTNLRRLECFITTSLLLRRLIPCCPKRQSKLNFEIARDQRRVALASQRDSSAMNTISILGIVFLPGMYSAVSSSN
ncbi:hypothetical protein B0O99DRAFT_524263, partial [Bisporella sp. PMI_857]